VTRLRIHGGRVVDPSQARDEVVDIVVVDGRIDAYVGADFGGEYDRVVDATGLVVSPGFIDLHCHLREPGFEDKETISTGALAAAAGGFTTICCMPNTNPTLDTANDVAYVFAKAREARGARVLPLGTITKGQRGTELSDASELSQAGVVGFSDDGRPVWDGRLMRYALMESLRHKKPVVNHCEEPEVADGGVMNQGRVSDLLGLKGQPAAAEDVMVARDIELARETGGRLHLAHISTEGSVRLLRMAKQEGLAVSAEVTPHHLIMTEDWVLGGNGRNGRPYDTRTKVNPPLRREQDRQALIAALAEGLIDVIATDHAPHRSIDKDCTYDEAAFGISGFETALGGLMQLVESAQLTMTDVIRRLTIEPSRTFDIAGGSLAVGSTADLVIFDPTASWTVDVAQFNSRGKNTPLDGHTLQGRVVTTIVGGDVVYEWRNVP